METSWRLSHAHANITILFEEEKDVVYVKWSGHMNAEDVLVTAKAYLALQEHWRCPNLLNDKSNVTGDWEEANNWLEYEWLPQAVQVGLKRFAHVVPADFQQEASAKDLIERFAHHCEAALFWDIELAKEWLTRPVEAQEYQEKGKSSKRN